MEKNNECRVINYEQALKYMQHVAMPIRCEVSNEGTRIVFIFDKTFNITEKEYQKLLKLLDKKEVYFIYSKKINNIIYFDETNYLMPDGIHLSLEGNKEIIKILKDNIK